MGFLPIIYYSNVFILSHLSIEGFDKIDLSFRRFSKNKKKTHLNKDHDVKMSCHRRFIEIKRNEIKINWKNSNEEKVTFSWDKNLNNKRDI